MSAPPTRRLLPSRPPELVVHDEPSTCPYLPDRASRLPLRLPLRSLTRTELDERLAKGDRRQGVLLYRTACPDCNACEPIRLDVDTFRPDRTMRRTLRRGDAELRTEVGPAVADDARVDLYNRHKHGRGLSHGDAELDLESYRAFLGDSCCETFELRYFLREVLIGVAIADRAATSLSAVYCYFDPALARLSLGTYSILKQVDLCRSWNLRHLYLGLYVADSPSMRYKARFMPHERLFPAGWELQR